jgi:hypothetical protein
VLTRVFDLAVLALCAVAVLLPRPDVQVQPGLKLDAQRLERVAELEAQLAADPGEPAAALELSDLFMDGKRPDWALSTVTRALDRAPSDHRLYTRRSLALADHFEAGDAYQAAARALALCDAGSSVPCAAPERMRIQLLHDTLDRVKDIDMRSDPNTAKERILRALKPAYVPRPKAASPAQPPAPATAPAAPQK